VDYGASHHTGRQLYSWDATATPATFHPKTSCSAITRPDGSNAGISSLVASQTLANGTRWCVDFARSTPPST
jgi:hypothetical protein